MIYSFAQKFYTDLRKYLCKFKLIKYANNNLNTIITPWNYKFCKLKMLSLADPFISLRFFWAGITQLRSSAKYQHLMDKSAGASIKRKPVHLDTNIRTYTYVHRYVNPYTAVVVRAFYFCFWNCPSTSPNLRIALSFVVVLCTVITYIRITRWWQFAQQCNAIQVQSKAILAYALPRATYLTCFCNKQKQWQLLCAVQ